MEEVFDELINHIKKVKQEYLQNQNNKNKLSKMKPSQELLNKEKYTITVNGITKNLTDYEFILMQQLLDADDMYCDYETLCDKIYDYRYDSSTAMSLKVLVARLRKKMGDLVIIKTRYSKGFEIVRIKGYGRS